MKFYSLIFYALSFVTAPTINAESYVDKNQNSGLLTWVASDNGFSIELIQLIPDFVRAIYAKHNFSVAEVERIANYCVFGSIIKNTSQNVLTYKVSDWRYSNNDTSLPVKTKTQWLDEWRKVGINFSWTLLPDSGTFEVGDWQQGFTTIQLQRDTQFDLIIKWSIENKHYNMTLEDVTCAPENLIERH